MDTLNTQTKLDELWRSYTTTPDVFRHQRFGQYVFNIVDDVFDIPAHLYYQEDNDKTYRELFELIEAGEV